MINIQTTQSENFTSNKDRLLNLFVPPCRYGSMSATVEFRIMGNFAVGCVCESVLSASSNLEWMISVLYFSVR